MYRCRLRMLRLVFLSESRTKAQSTTKTSENIPKPENTITDRRGLERFNVSRFLRGWSWSPTKKRYTEYKSIAIDVKYADNGNAGVLRASTVDKISHHGLQGYTTSRASSFTSVYLSFGVRLTQSNTTASHDFHFVLCEKKYNLYVVFECNF